MYMGLIMKGTIFGGFSHHFPYDKGQITLTILANFQVSSDQARPWLFLLGHWLNFKLFGITYFVGKIKFKLLFHGPLAK